MAEDWPQKLNWMFSREDRPRPGDFERIGALRHLHHRGGPFGSGPFGGGPPFGGGRGRRRRGDVRLALLRLLNEEPRNGYQLMQTIEERSGGSWRPSPGSVYPTLAQLEDEGLVRSLDREGGKVFELTDAGREHVADKADTPPPWDEGDEAGASSFPQLGSLLIQVGKAAWQVAQVGDEDQTARACETLADTKRALYRILAEDQSA
jgi:DNA-binding PadR family transcriptional regulator